MFSSAWYSISTYIKTINTTGDHIKQDLPGTVHTRRPLHFAIFTNNISFYLLWPPVIVRTRRPLHFAIFTNNIWFYLLRSPVIVRVCTVGLDVCYTRYTHILPYTSRSYRPVRISQVVALLMVDLWLYRHVSEARKIALKRKKKKKQPRFETKPNRSRQQADSLSVTPQVYIRILISMNTNILINSAPPSKSTNPVILIVYPGTFF